MEGLLTRLYRRWGRWYVAIPCACGYLAGLIFTSIITSVGTLSYLGLPGRGFRHILVLAVLGAIVGVTLSILAAFRLARDVLVWLGGARTAGSAEATWEEGVGLTARIHARAVPIMTLATLPAMVAASREADLNWQVVFVVLACVAGIIAAIMVNAFVFEIWLRPILVDVSERLPRAGFEPQVRQPSLRTRLVPSIIIISFLSAFLTSGLSGRADSAAARVVTTMAAAAVVSVLALLLTLALAHSVVAPVRELLDATRRVRAGNLSTVLPMTSNDEIGQLTRSFNEMVGGLAERAALHSALGTYIDPLVADRLLEEGEYLKGEALEVTVVFIDIVGFVTRAERMPAAHVVAELNEFFEIVVPVIETHQGHTNKLLGDGLMAVFGTPMPLIDHADHALAAACEIQDKIWARYADDLRVGIGINSGTAIVGTTGGGRKLDFTVYGDTVNLASRVEALTRTTGDTILLTEATRLALQRPASLDPRGSVAIRGRAEPTQLYSAVASRHG